MFEFTGEYFDNVLVDGDMMLWLLCFEGWDLFLWELFLVEFENLGECAQAAVVGMDVSVRVGFLF